MKLIVLIGALLLQPFVAVAQTDKSQVPAPSSDATKPAREAKKRPQFLIILRLAPRLHDDQAWTPADNAAVGAHFRRLQEAAKTGDVILAGRTAEAGNRTIGLVVFEADDEAAARRFMEEDPCVAGGQMIGELRPYSVAIWRK